ncbi:hypothetical protein CEXT_270341 [Caerostris extrusa]|uniref:Uncharacterized protein n=1 Tax=Caerostris extrusa TaxID=172846 RepID=A0AAV4SAF8_CAEEX|nr:hypothetical protein CEXT_270341 [Caerostris extrusa]
MQFQNKERETHTENCYKNKAQGGVLKGWNLFFYRPVFYPMSPLDRYPFIWGTLGDVQQTASDINTKRLVTERVGGELSVCSRGKRRIDFMILEAFFPTRGEIGSYSKSECVL